MKALLVADDKLAIDNISQVLEIAGYDVIVYKWLLKALDNIEEIEPHIIIVSTKDYPRHWKTLAQFASTAFGGYKPEIILYTAGQLDDDEKNKAQILNVRGVFSSVDVSGLDELRHILAKEVDIYSGNLLDDEGNLVKKEEKLIQDTSKVDDLDDTEDFNNEENLTSTEELNSNEEQTDKDNLDDTDYSLNKSESPSNDNLTEQDELTLEDEQPCTDEPILEANSESENFIAYSLNDTDGLSDTYRATADSTDDNIASEEYLNQEVVAVSDTDEFTNEENSLSSNANSPLESSSESSSEKEYIYCSFIFTNPVSGELVTGYARNFDGKTFEFDADISDFVKNLSEGTFIPIASMKVHNELNSVSAFVKENGRFLRLELKSA